MRAATLCLITLLLAAVCWFSNPFADVLSSRAISLVGLSPSQRANICTAASALNGRVIKPGQELSFNGAVGPRSDNRGYRRAPSYLGLESPSTFGGGICLVSSALYQIALESNMTVCQRVAHLRTVRSVPPGYDATVWYGQADLRFRNDLDAPIMIAAQSSANELRMNIFGRCSAQHTPAKLSRLVTATNSEDLSVEVFRQQNGKTSLVSRDLYRLSP